MVSGYIIFLVLVAVVQGSFASSPDVELAFNETTRHWTKAMQILFDWIDGNSTSDGANVEYLKCLVEGAEIYFATLKSPAQNGSSSTLDEYSENFKKATNIVFGAIDLARSENGSYIETVGRINASEAAIQHKAIATPFLNQNGSASSSQTKVLADLISLYEYFFNAIRSLAARTYGIENGIDPSFRTGAVTDVEAISKALYKL